jgi:hypothetical protein
MMSTLARTLSNRPIADRAMEVRELGTVTPSRANHGSYELRGHGQHAAGSRGRARRAGRRETGAYGKGWDFEQGGQWGEDGRDERAVLCGAPESRWAKLEQASPRTLRLAPRQGDAAEADNPLLDGPHVVARGRGCQSSESGDMVSDRERRSAR